LKLLLGRIKKETKKKAKIKTRFYKKINLINLAPIFINIHSIFKNATLKEAIKNHYWRIQIM